MQDGDPDFVVTVGMTLSDWLIIVGAAAALPVLGYATYHQWSRRPGAMGRMVGGCALAAVIISVSMLGGYVAR